jgi:hypothetical protein
MSYEDDKTVSENKRQVDHKNAGNQTDHTNADVNHYRRLLTAAHVWKVKNNAYEWLQSHGYGPQALGDDV